MIREPNTEYVLSLSYGKDSLACLEAIKQLGYPLDRIVHAEVWATDTIPADLPPMVEFKQKADQQILDRYGITVEHICASRAVERERERERVTYEKLFYKMPTTGKHIGNIKGFPLVRGGWCKHLKTGYTADLRRYILSTAPAKESIWLSNEKRELVHTAQDEGFLIAPGHKAQLEISYSISE